MHVFTYTNALAHTHEPMHARSKMEKKKMGRFAALLSLSDLTCTYIHMHKTHAHTGARNVCVRLLTHILGLG
jgi:hypothetical protein